MTSCTILACHASAVTIGKVASNVATLLSWCRRHIGGTVAGTLYKSKLKEWGTVSYASALTVQAARKIGNQIVYEESAPTLGKD